MRYRNPSWEEFERKHVGSRDILNSCNERNVEMKKAFLIGGGLVFAAMPLCARTVALWPLNWNGDAGNVNCRCALDVDNNMTADANLGYTSGQGAELGWARSAVIRRSQAGTTCGAFRGACAARTTFSGCRQKARS